MSGAEHEKSSGTGGGHRETDFEMVKVDPRQPSLFPLGDLVVPERLAKMKKSVSAIQAVPVTRDSPITLNSRRLFDACILVAQLDFRSRRPQEVERIQTERISPMFEIQISKFAQLASIPGKNFERLYEELHDMMSMELQWNVIGEDSSVEFEMRSRFLTSIGVGRGSQKGKIRFSIEPSALALVLEPKTWATLSLNVMSRLSTPTSYALYQNVWRYVNTNQKVTAALPVTTWAELLLGPSRYVIDDSKRGKVMVEYSDFKRRVLLPAISRVNEVPALNYTISLKEHVTGKRVVRLQFEFHPKLQESLELPVLWPDEVVKLLESMGFTPSAVADLGQAHSFQEVMEAIERLKQAEQRMRAKGQVINSRKAYLLGILGKLAEGARAEDDDKLMAEIAAKEAAEMSAERQARQREAFSKHQSEVFARHLFEAEESLRMQLLQDFAGTKEGERARVLLDKGWSPSNTGALVLLRTWVTSSRPDALAWLLPNPEHRDFEAWMAWRLDTLSS